MSGTVDKREIITDPIVAASRRELTENQSIEGQSIFVAHRMKNTPLDGNFRGQLRIDSYGLLDAEITDGRNLFPAHPGTYTIRYSEEGAAPLCLSLPVTAGWDTQIFFVEDGGRPVLERASVFMQPAGKGFDPRDALIDAYELALADLVSGGPGPDQVTLDMLLYGKFKNPLFGLVGAHFLVRELRMDRTKPPARLWLLDLVIENMGKLLGLGNADVLALKLLRGQLTGIPYQIAGTPSPPLLRASLLALIDATAEQPQLFETRFDEIAIGQVADSPWCCWREAEAGGEASTWEQYPEETRHHNVLLQYGPRSEAIEKLLTAENFSLVAHDDNGLRRIRAQGAARKDVTGYSDMARLVSTPDWVVDTVRDEMLQSARTERPINMARLVTRLGLPRGVLEQALRIAEQDVVPDAATGDTLRSLTADIVAAHVASNSVDAGDMSELIAIVHRTLTNLRATTDTGVPEPQPAVPIRDSVKPDYIVCLEDGKKLKMLKRHLMTHYQMTPADYRAKGKLPADYRTHADPMQIVSGALHAPRVHFEAPPSDRVPYEMAQFITWFNDSSPQGGAPLPAITRAAIAHLWFETIHPFEDGNGRIGRAIAEKALAQSLETPTLTALAATINRHKKAYYAELHAASQTNEIDAWMGWFAAIVLEAQSRTIESIRFLIEKTRLLDRLHGKINTRQEKALIRMMAEGPDGFAGGLSAHNYRTITDAASATATRDLADLVELGALERIGDRRYARYYLTIATNAEGLTVDRTDG